MGRRGDGGGTDGEGREEIGHFGGDHFDLQMEKRGLERGEGGGRVTSRVLGIGEGLDVRVRVL